MTGITGCSIAWRASSPKDDSVMTLRSFIDGEGEALVLEEIDELARHRAFDAGAAPARCALYAPHP